MLPPPLLLLNIFSLFVIYIVMLNISSLFPGPDMELTFHDGTVRDMVFMQDTSNRSSLLISGGAGDCKIYVTDCETGTPVRVMSGHSGKRIVIYVVL